MNYMRHTVFDTPVLKPILRRLSSRILKWIGWKIEGTGPNIPKYVMIAEPHTSNWDFVLTLLITFVLGLKVYTMGKKELVDHPFGFFFQWLGLIPIDRSQPKGMVNQAIEVFQQSESLVLIVPPSGTRKRVNKWKTGFYYIALGAGVPIALGFLDYAKNTGGIGPIIEPSGNYEADLIRIKAFYAGMVGKNSEQEAPEVSLKALDVLTS